MYKYIYNAQATLLALQSTLHLLMKSKHHQLITDSHVTVDCSLFLGPKLVPAPIAYSIGKQVLG